MTRRGPCLYGHVLLQRTIFTRVHNLKIRPGISRAHFMDNGLLIGVVSYCNGYLVDIAVCIAGKGKVNRFCFYNDTKLFQIHFYSCVGRLPAVRGCF